MIERRHVAEVRLEGRTLSGTAMTFGDVSPSHRERFEPGSLRLAAAVHFNLHHDPERVIAWLPDGGLEIRDAGDALELTATLPPIPAADRALAEARNGQVTGLSIEFHAESERREAGIRVIEAAELVGVGLVEHPSYTNSRVESREAAGAAWWWWA